MAFFNKKKIEKKEAVVETKASTAQNISHAAVSANGLAHVLSHARITEKATMLQSGGVYSFDVAERATKNDVALAIKALYGVTPRKIAVVRITKKSVRNARTGRSGVKGGGKKAYVYLKKGETITIS